MRVASFTIRALSAAAVPALIAMAQPSFPLRVHATSRIWVNGTSTVKSWECRAKSFTAAVDASSADAVHTVIAGEKTVEAVTLTVPVQQMDCSNGTMNEHMLKALKAKEFADITFTLDSYELTKGADLSKVSLKGTLTMGGVTKPVAFEADASAGPEGSLKIAGKYRLNMKDYSLQPPKLMLGTLKVNEMVDVSFEVFLKP
jgi:polyisoprenoid-binding protein YceI